MPIPTLSQPSENNTISPELSWQLKQIKKQFKEDIGPALKNHRYFISRGRRKPSNKKKSRRFTIRFSPFAMTLGNGIGVSKMALPTSRTALPALAIPSSPFAAPVFKPRQIAQLPDQIVSTFVIAVIQSDPQLYVLQKIQRKAAIGFPGGSIEPGENILQTAKREFFEETCGKDRLGGVDIGNYNPTCIGQFTLNRAVNGEQGVVVLVEIPEYEKIKIVAGGGDQTEGELVEEIHFMTFEQLLQTAENGTMLTNSKKVLEIYLNYLVS